MNSVCMIGRVCNDLELKTTNSGVSVTSFNLAVDRSYTPKGQEKQTDFIPCVAWRGTAEFISKYFRKGNKIAVKGELQQRTYTANDGSKRNVFEVIVDGAFFCESKNEPSVEMKAAVTSNKPSEWQEVGTDEELPFN